MGSTDWLTSISQTWRRRQQFVCVNISHRMKPFLPTLKIPSPCRHAKACCIHSDLHGPGCTLYTTAASSARNKMNAWIKCAKCAIPNDNICRVSTTKCFPTHHLHYFFQIFSEASQGTTVLVSCQQTKLLSLSLALASEKNQSRKLTSTLPTVQVHKRDKRVL